MGERSVTQLTGSGGHSFARQGTIGLLRPAGYQSFRAGKNSTFGRAEGGIGLPDDVGFLADAGLARSTLEQAAKIAGEKGMLASEVLIARGHLDRAVYGEMLAQKLGIGYFNTIDGPVRAIGDVPRIHDDQPLLAGEMLIVPATGYWASKLLRLHEHKPNSPLPIAIAAPLSICLALHGANRIGHLAVAADDLGRNYPGMSAKDRMSLTQVACICISTIAIASAAVFSQTLGGLIAGILLSCFYCTAVLFRALMAWWLDGLPSLNNRNSGSRSAAEDLPRYSVLVALYREAGQSEALIASLEKLDWPVDRREVFLVCEGDDHETIAAIEKTPLPTGFCLVKCPPSLPRTKPKALNFALPLARGTYTVIYDAEDRPHRGQLREAHSKFQTSGEQVACLQAPLAIHNHGQNWLTSMFALEYQTLFFGLLPVLSRMGGPVPLGGTSNHFKTDILKKVGGWDAWNVTEDADLGVRLSRFGYHCGTLDLPTLEEAPPIFDVWLKQRTRWLKGWIQTILVHTRNPSATHQQLGLAGSVLFHLALTSIVLSALIHPVFIVVVGAGLIKLASQSMQSHLELVFLAIALFNLAAGYFTYAALAAGVARRCSKHVNLWLLVSLPLYWLLISLAAWRAVWHFIVKPFQWEKTRHGLANCATNAIIPD